MFRPSDAYLLGIYTHNDWARQELVHVIVRNWSDAGLFVKSNYAQGLRAQFSDDDRLQLRRVNVNEALFEVDGAFYGPPGLGLTTEGGSFAAARRAMGYMANLRHFATTSTTTSPRSDANSTTRPDTRRRASGSRMCMKAESAS